MRALYLADILDLDLTVKFCRVSEFADAACFAKRLGWSFMSAIYHATQVLVCMLEFDVVHFHSALVWFDWINFLSILGLSDLLQVVLADCNLFHGWPLIAWWRCILWKANEVFLGELIRKRWTLVLKWARAFLITGVHWWILLVTLIFQLHLLALDMQSLQFVFNFHFVWHLRRLILWHMRRLWDGLLHLAMQSTLLFVISVCLLEMLVHERSKMALIL